jgi:hypothetical protein
MNQCFTTELQVQLGLRQGNGEKTRQNVTPNRSDLHRPQYPNPFDQVIPQHQTQHSTPVNIPVTQC